MTKKNSRDIARVKFPQKKTLGFCSKIEEKSLARELKVAGGKCGVQTHRKRPWPMLRPSLRKRECTGVVRPTWSSTSLRGGGVFFGLMQRRLQSPLSAARRKISAARRKISAARRKISNGRGNSTVCSAKISGVAHDAVITRTRLQRGKVLTSAKNVMRMVHRWGHGSKISRSYPFIILIVSWIRRLIVLLAKIWHCSYVIWSEYVQDNRSDLRAD